MQYRSPVALTRWMIGFVATTVLLNISAVLVLLANPRRTSEAQDLTDISNLPRLIAGILFYVWIYRLYKNLTALSVHGLKSIPGIAVLMCMLPIVNLYQPVVIFGEIWRASASQASVVQAGGRWKAVPFAPIIVCWWIAYLLYSLVIALNSRDVNSSSDPTSYLFIGLTSLISGILMIILAVRLSRREEIRHAEALTSLQV